MNKTMPSPIKYDRKQRFNWYLQADKYNKSVTEVYKIFGISRKCYYKWRARDYGKREVTPTCLLKTCLTSN